MLFGRIERLKGHAIASKSFPKQIMVEYDQCIPL